MRLSKNGGDDVEDDDEDDDKDNDKDNGKDNDKDNGKEQNCNILRWREVPGYAGS